VYYIVIVRIDNIYIAFVYDVIITAVLFSTFFPFSISCYSFSLVGSSHKYFKLSILYLSTPIFINSIY
jgi:hypothetical protein